MTKKPYRVVLRKWWELPQVSIIILSFARMENHVGPQKMNQKLIIISTLVATKPHVPWLAIRVALQRKGENTFIWLELIMWRNWRKMWAKKILLLQQQSSPWAWHVPIMAVIMLICAHMPSFQNVANAEMMQQFRAKVYFLKKTWCTHARCCSASSRVDLDAAAILIKGFSSSSSSFHLQLHRHNFTRAADATRAKFYCSFGYTKFEPAIYV